MKNFPLLFGLVLFFAFAVSAQINPDSSCPTIDVRHGGRPELNEITYFIVDVDTKGRDLKLEYIWSVSGGKITEGQGTQTIAVKFLGNEQFGVTVEIKSFPEGCPNTYTELPNWGDTEPSPIKIGEFLNFDTQNEKIQLKELKKEIADTPSAQVYVFMKFKKNSSERKAVQKLKKTGVFLMKELAVNADRITMVKVFGESEYTEIWLVPAGAYPPTPQN